MKNRRGFTLVETLVAVFIFMVVSLTFYRAFGVVMEGVRLLRVKGTASYLANEQFEIIRNMPYADVGISGGLPAGVIPYKKTYTRDGIAFEVTTTVRNVDLPQDGTIGGLPNDTSPADSKIIELEIMCTACALEAPLEFTTHVSPKNLESTGNNGALFITVIDSSGNPVEGADILVQTVKGTTSITVNDTTGELGMLQLVDVPPLVNGYRIYVEKEDYSSERTYPISTSTPGKPDATVAKAQVTNITFVIDEVASLAFTSRDTSCAVVGGMDFTMTGGKTLAGLPEYNIAHVTSGSGTLSLLELEWDTYKITGTDPTYMIVGTNPVSPITLNPGAMASMDIVVAPKSLPALHVAVVDSTGLPISDAEVTLDMSAGADKVATTGRGSTSQTDWSGGGGQETIGDSGKYFSSNGNVAVLSPVGELRLTGAAPSYSSSGVLESSAFDLGTSSIFHTLSWLPGTQLAGTGANSVRFQLASNEVITPTSTWNYIGPSGSASDYYTSSGASIASAHSGARYLRYKAFLSTASTTYTPTVSDVSFTYTTGCVPPGQVLFTGVSVGSATITVRKAGYADTTSTITLGTGWQTQTITLSN